MRIRIVLALLLLLPTAVSAAQDLDAAVSALVRISGTRGGTPVRGSGFVIGLDRDKATIVTAAHVIEGVQQLEIVFAADLTERFPVDVVLGMDSGNPNGLAAFQVRGALPARAATLSFEIESRPRLGEALFLLGFPEMASAPRTTQRVLSARSGTLLLIDQGIGEGFSGGPVLRDGKVVGVVTDMDSQTTYAVNAVVTHEALEGWEVKLGGQGNTPAPSSNIITSTNKALASPDAIPSKPITSAERQKMDQITQGLREGSSVKEIRAAFQLAREVADTRPDLREAQHLAAEAAYRVSRWSDAVTYFRRGGDPNEAEPERLFYMAVALYETGDTTGAASALRRGLPNLQRTTYVDSYAKKILGQPTLKTCVPGEERTEADIVFVRICPGTFTMGSAETDPQAYENEKPAHQVTLNEFWISQTEITNKQYRHFQSNHQGEDELPATNISWTNAEAACKHFGGRLPTEAEWEYAARAGSRTSWSFGEDKERLSEHAWHDKNATDKSHPVATRKPNAWGLHDMHGNVWEWVADWYSPYLKGPQANPTGPTTGEDRIMRGGSYIDDARDLRSALRGWNKPEEPVRTISFRCAWPRR